MTDRDRTTATGRSDTPAARPDLGGPLLCLVLVAALGVALTGDAGSAPPPTPGPVSAGRCGPPPGCEPVAPAPADPDPVPREPDPDPTGTAGAPAAPPTRVRIPRIHVDTPLARLGLDRTGRLTPPSDFAVAGWYAAGVAPGDVGPAVLAGHVDSRTGPAVFHRLSELAPGDLVEVRRGRRWLRFRVTGVSRHAKAEFPTTAVYGPTPGPELRLITCTGTFDRSAGHYRDNLVVFAVADLPVTPDPAVG